MCFAHIHISTDVDDSNSNLEDCNINSENNAVSNRACGDTCQLTSAHSLTRVTTSRSTLTICQASRRYQTAYITEKGGKLDLLHIDRTAMICNYKTDPFRSQSRHKSAYIQFNSILVVQNRTTTSISDGKPCGQQSIIPNTASSSSRSRQV
ncbi:hypothetical protein GALMADRAFT_229158 [Galerina marginata CBS 339.88]|uniref:Uncharacterized protein n=1 Tax=Galerina marginata (strain CBS 339.88) TaxID=685588 RepID=A0A067T057_GALM3|nr:hypothetical protein GALMADRAFT_229158 [Galerina marginata CBS 339.88]